MNISDARGDLHVVGRFDDPHTGAERSMPDLATALQGQRRVHLWSDVPVHPYFAAQGVRQLPVVDDAHFPVVGTLLVGGVHVLSLIHISEPTRPY